MLLGWWLLLIWRNISSLFFRWNFVVSLMPLWLAPNLITIIGLAVNVLTSLVHLYFCPTAKEEVWLTTNLLKSIKKNLTTTISSFFQVPSWVPFLCALGLFIYQTLDAIDGKQARRTQSSNALGELFDHGCDSMSTAFVTLAGACTMGMGYLPYFMMFECFTATVLFYMAHWQTYVTGKMRFGKFDVTEAQLIMMSTMMTSALFGTGFWGWQMFGVMPLRWMPLICGTIAALFSIPPTINHILFGGAGKNGATIAVRIRVSNFTTFASIF